MSSQSSQLTAAEILDILQAHQSVLQSLGVRKLGLFGSYRRGTAKRNSDLDFLLVLERPSFDAYMDTKIFLEDLFKRRVDLVLEHSLKPRLRPYIMSEVIYVSGL